MKEFSRILTVLTVTFLLIGCNIYSSIDEGSCNWTEGEGMHLSFTISAGEQPNYAPTKASTSISPDLEDGTEWENYINITDNDYRIYLFDDNKIYRETLIPEKISANGNQTYDITVNTSGIYNDFTIVILANWDSKSWNMVNAGCSYPTLTLGVSKIDDIWETESGLRVYDATSGKSFVPSKTALIPMYGARNYKISSVNFSDDIIKLGTFYLIRSLAKVDVYVDEGSGITLESIQLNRYSNVFHCTPKGMYSIENEWDQPEDENINIGAGSFSPSTIDFMKVGTNLYRLYLPEYPNKKDGVIPSIITIRSIKNGIANGGTIMFENLNILRNNYYKFRITKVTNYTTDVVMDVVPFDYISNEIVFE